MSLFPMTIALTLQPTQIPFSRLQQPKREADSFQINSNEQFQAEKELNGVKHTSKTRAELSGTF
jgi:hypothetical protein